MIITSKQHDSITQLILIDGHPTKYLTNTAQNCQGHKNKESLRSCHNQEEAKNS